MHVLVSPTALVFPSQVDLGPSGSDSFSELKQRYGFESVEDWRAPASSTTSHSERRLLSGAPLHHRHAVADYRGPFTYCDADGRVTGQGPSWAELDPPDWLFDEASPVAAIQRALALRR